MLAREYMRALVQPEDRQALLDTIHRTAEMLPPLGALPSYTRDPKDDKFVGCALAGSASYVITLDRDLLTLRVFGDVRMVTPDEFLKAFDCPKGLGEKLHAIEQDFEQTRRASRIE